MGVLSGRVNPLMESWIKYESRRAGQTGIGRAHWGMSPAPASPREGGYLPWVDVASTKQRRCSGGCSAVAFTLLFAYQPRRAMSQRLRTLLSRVTGIWPDTEEGTIWVQRMTYQGGWERTLPDFHQDDLRERPTPDDEYILPGPGRYRAIRRKNGRLGETLWEYETADAESHYDRQRRKADQQERLSQMSVQELHGEFSGQTDELDLLSLDTIYDQFEARGGYEALNSNQS